MVTIDFREIPGINMLDLQGSVFPDFSGGLLDLYAGPSAPYNPTAMLWLDPDDGLAAVGVTGQFYYSGGVLETSRVTSLKVYNNDESTDYRMYISGFNLPFYDVLFAVETFDIMPLFAGQQLDVMGTLTYGDVLTGGNESDDIAGFGGNDTLFGSGGNDLLMGGTGVDQMNGGAGDDDYEVDQAGDSIIEDSIAGGGIDFVVSTVTYTLPVNVEGLSQASAVGAVNGTGNAGANYLGGNSAVNVLNGLGGNDVILGADGNDSLNGGTGIDTMNGGMGNDVFVSDVATDVIQEVAGQGTDTLQSAATRVLGTTLEHLTLTGSAHINGTGNAVANILTGNAGNNILNGSIGNDTVIGGAGNDTLVWGTADFFDGGVGTDVLRVDGKGVNINLVTLSNAMMKNMETINITGSGNNNLTVSITEVLNISTSSNTLRIDGNTGDIVHRGAGWLGGSISGGYRSYTKSGATLLVDSDITSVI